MLSKLFPLTLALAGTGIGIGAGLLLRPEPAPPAAAATAAAPEPTGKAEHAAGEAAPAAPAADPVDDDDFVKLDRQFIVPVLSEGRVASMVVMSLTLALDPGIREGVLDRMPRLYDRFLRVMLDHANTGGFDGAFTANGAMDGLEAALLDAGRAELGTGLREILVLDLNRRDV